MKTVKVKIFVNQLGNLKINWEIPFYLLSDKKELQIEIPNFKYDLPKIAGLPLPLSSKAMTLEIKNIQIGNDLEFDFKYELLEKFSGNNILSIDLKDITNQMRKHNLNISYEINDIVNNDTIFFVFVYPLINPFNENIDFDIEVYARFSYNIKKFKFFEWYFNKNNGEKVELKKMFSKKKVGDLIILNAEGIHLGDGIELDIHLTGTRLPIMIRRDIFWIIVFIIFLSIILSPVWSAFIKK